MNNCNDNFRELAEYVKRGVWQAGGTPLEFPTISLGELFMRPTTMLYRNLMAMDTEEMIRAHPLHGVVLLANCDKTAPAQMMGAASADVPAILLTGGPHLSGRFRGESLGACSDCRRFWAEYRARTIDEDAMRELEDGINRSDGHCTVMGTASTMAAMAEALGMALPGIAAIPAPDARRLRLAEAAGRQIVETVRLGIRPSDLLTQNAFENAIRLMMALGGSTNAVIHLTAIAGRRRTSLPIDLFDRISRETPFITNLRPSGTFHMEQLFDAGGVPAVMKELARGGLLHLDERSITGRSIGEQLDSVPPLGEDATSGGGWSGAERIIFPLEHPLRPQGRNRHPSRQSCTRRCRHQADRRLAASDETPWPHGGLFVDDRPGGTHRRSGSGRDGRWQAYWCSRTPARKGLLACRRPVDCRFPRNCWRGAYAIWCGSRMRA